MPILSAFPGFCPLLKLNRPRRLTRTIIHYAIHALHLIDDPIGHLMQHLPRNLRSLRRHKVTGRNRSEGYGIVIGSFIAHNSNRPQKNHLKEVRTEKKLSQAQLAEMVGVSRNTISSIETGQFNPTAKLALILCIALDKKFEELFYF